MTGPTTGAGKHADLPDAARRLPRDELNAGPETAARYDYQYECVALTILQRLPSDDLLGVVLEHSTDAIFVPCNGVPELVSIKHREPNQEKPGWTLNELKRAGVFAELYRTWVAASKQCTVAFRSNAGLAQSGGKLYRAVVRQNASCYRFMVKYFTDNLGIDNQEAQDFLSALKLDEHPFPSRNDISDVAVAHVRRYIVAHRGGAGQFAERCYDLLLARIREASTDVPASRRTVEEATAATLRELNDRREELELRRRYISSDEVRDEMLAEFDRLTASALPGSEPRWELDPRFTGRAEQLRALVDMLQPGIPHPVAPVVLHGVTGGGKTSLATQFAALHSDMFRATFINATTRAGLVQAIQKLALGWDAATWTEGVAEARGPVTPPLPGTSRTLLILDGVTDPDVVRGLVPRRSLCRVLITSTVRQLDDGFLHLELGEWTSEESREFLAVALPAASIDERERLAAALHHHPLALTQAANHCSLVDRSVDEFLQRLRAAPLDTLTLGDASGHKVSIIEAIRLNLIAAHQQSPVARDLLTVLAYLGSDPVPRSLFAKDGMLAFVQRPTPDPIPRRRWSRWRARAQRSSNDFSHLRPTEQASNVAQRLFDPAQRDKAVEALLRLSLVSIRSDDFVVHPLIGLVVRHLAGDPTPWLEIGFGLFADKIGHSPSDEDHALDAHLGHLAELCVTAIEAGLRGPAVIGACGLLARRLSVLGRNNDTATHRWTAVDFGQHAVDLSSTRTADDDPSLMRLVYGQRASLAQALYMEGRVDEAIDLFMRNAAAGTQMRSLSLWLNAVRNAGLAAAETCRAEVASDVLQKISTMAPEMTIDLGQQVALAHVQIRLLRMLNRIGEAVALTEWALEHVLNPDADLTEQMREFIHDDAALLSRDEDRPEDRLRHELASLNFHRKRQQSRMRTDRPLIDALASAADAAIEVGQFDLAGGLLNEADSLAVEEFGKPSFERAAVLAVRGRLDYHQGDLQKAKGSLKPAVEILRTAPEGQRAPLPSALVHLAHVESVLGDSDTALSLANEAYEIDLAQFGPNHPETRKDLNVIKGIEVGITIRQRPPGSIVVIRGSDIFWEPDEE